MEFYGRKFKAGQSVSVYGPRVQTDFILLNKGLGKGGVAENNPFPKIIFRRQERVSYPCEIFDRLILDIDAGSETGMNHIIILKLDPGSKGS